MSNRVLEPSGNRIKGRAQLVLWVSVLLVLLVFPMKVDAQGFAWEWPAREPLSMPSRFVGLEVVGGYATHSTDVTYMHDLLPCCTFENGTSIPFRLQVLGESWIAAKTAVSIGLGVMMSTTSFTAPGDTLPYKSTQVITQYAYDASLSYATIEGGIRHRLFDSFLSVGFSLRGEVFLSSSETLIDKVLSPDEYYFTDNPPSKEKEITSNFQSSFASFVLEPGLSLQYDIPLGTGLYLAPSVNLSIPVTSVSSDATWRYVFTGVGFKLMRGL